VHGLPQGRRHRLHTGRRIEAGLQRDDWKPCRLKAISTCSYLAVLSGEQSDKPSNFSICARQRKGNSYKSHVHNNNGCFSKLAAGWQPSETVKLFFPSNNTGCWKAMKQPFLFPFWNRIGGRSTSSGSSLTRIDLAAPFILLFFYVSPPAVNFVFRPLFVCSQFSTRIRCSWLICEWIHLLDSLFIF